MPRPKNSRPQTRSQAAAALAANAGFMSNVIRAVGIADEICARLDANQANQKEVKENATNERIAA